MTDELKEKYPATLSLAIGAAMIYLSVGVVAGVYRGAISRHLRRTEPW